MKVSEKTIDKIQENVRTLKIKKKKKSNNKKQKFTNGK